MARMVMRYSFQFRKLGVTLSTVRFTSRNVLKLSERGLYEDMFPANSSNEILKILNAKPQTIYAGFDPTADSLHVGHLLVLMGLLHWQRAGHNVIALVGTATAQIGDPSGRKTERDELGSGVVMRNAAALSGNLQQIFDNHRVSIWDDSKGKLGNFMLLDNSHWLSQVTAAEFVGGVGRHMRLGAMLSRDSIRTRLAADAPASLADLCYQAFQAYDWLHLYRKYNCRFQLGGNDQMGNIVAGHDLVSRVKKTTVYGLTVPLVTSEEGDKLGKSAGNAVWVGRERGSPFGLYQFFMRTTDTMVERLLLYFTFDSVAVVQDLMQKHSDNPGKRMAQRRLAEIATTVVFGKAGLKEAEETTAALYGGDLEALSRLAPGSAASALEGATLCRVLLRPGLTVADMGLEAGAFSRPQDAERICSAGGVSINHQRVTNAHEVLTRAVHILPNNLSLLRVGKKNYYIVEWQG